MKNKKNPIHLIPTRGRRNLVQSVLASFIILLICISCDLKITEAQNNFWDIFTSDYRLNCLAWEHYRDNPVIPAQGNSWKKNWTANPDYLEFKGEKLIFYRGNGVFPDSAGKSHDRIAVAKINKILSGIFEFEDLNNRNFIIDVGKAGEFDSRDVLDPATIIFDNQIYLYYSAIGEGPDAIGLAISRDGVNFKKTGKIMDGRAPDVILKDEKIYMIFQRQIEGQEGYRGFYLASSEDGFNFQVYDELPVFNTPENGWDKQIATGRLFEQDNIFYMIYGGSPEDADQPDYFGLARSKDLIHWERHPGNPIFGCGAKGAEDGGAIWFPALIETGDSYILLYEGSRGKYSWDLSSQICMSSIKKKKINSSDK